MKTFGDVIPSRRREMGMTQAELAAKMNVTDKAVSKWERNISCPDISSLPRLAEELVIPIEELLGAKKSSTEGSGEFSEVLDVVLKAIPLAMGIAVTVLMIMQKIEFSGALLMLGIGLTLLSIDALRSREKK